MPHSNALLTLASCPINVNGYNTSFLKTLLFLDPVLLTSSPLPLLNAILILPTLNPSNKKWTVPATAIVRKLKSRWRRCYRTALSNLVLVLWPAQNTAVFGSSIADLSSTPFFKCYIDTANAKPLKQKAHRASHHHRKEIEKQVEEMLQNGIIKPSVSALASPVVLVKKADKTLRLCIDYQSLNKATIKDSYPLRHFKDTLDM